ncbi:hypothetical protein HAX54_038767, partial [Datura stramonium]|nr:hypothetical protein [Datura stramonium]
MNVQIVHLLQDWENLANVAAFVHELLAMQECWEVVTLVALIHERRNPKTPTALVLALKIQLEYSLSF